MDRPIAVWEHSSGVKRPLFSCLRGENGEEAPIVDNLVEKPVDNLSTTEATVRHFESFEIGQVYVSEWQTMSEDLIQQFASITGDHNPIHLDADFAKRTIHRGVIAHGLLVAGLSTGMAFACGLLGKNILALESSSEKYFGAVRPGDEIYGKVTIKEMNAEASRRCGRVLWLTQVFKKLRDGTESLVMEAVWSTLVFKKQYVPK